MNTFKKIVASIAIVALTTTSLFAYDLTNKEKAKGDVIANKVLLLVSKKAEEKQAKFKEKIIFQLEWIYEKARKNEKMQALVWYVIEKVKSGDKAEISRYPWCSKDDIVLSNGQVWAACDVGSSKAWEAWEKFAWGSMNGYKDPGAISDKSWPANDWNEKDPQGPCRNGYHIPSKVEVEKAKVSNLGKNPKDDILWIWKDKNYWTTTPGMYDSAYFFQNFYNIDTWEINAFYLGWSESHKAKWEFRIWYSFIRCIKD